MSADDVYLFLVDDVWKEIEKQNPYNEKVMLINAIKGYRRMLDE